MTYSDITSNFNKYAQLMIDLHTEHSYGLILRNPYYYDVMKLLADEVYQTSYVPLEAIVKPYIDAEKNKYDLKITDLNAYSNDLYTNGRTVTIVSEFDDRKRIDYFEEVDNMYKLYYILEYYQEMTDTTLPTYWINTPERFAVVNEQSHIYFEQQSVNLLTQLT